MLSNSWTLDEKVFESTVAQEDVQGKRANNQKSFMEEAINHNRHSVTTATALYVLSWLPYSIKNHIIVTSFMSHLHPTSDSHVMILLANKYVYVYYHYHGISWENM